MYKVIMFCKDKSFTIGEWEFTTKENLDEFIDSHKRNLYKQDYLIFDIYAIPKTWDWILSKTL